MFLKIESANNVGHPLVLIVSLAPGPGLGWGREEGHTSTGWNLTFL